MASVLQTALGYLEAGLGVLPVRPDGSKAPALPRGHPYLRHRPDKAELHRWFASGRNGIGIPCGQVSGGLETLDFETLAIYRVWRSLVEARTPGLVGRLCRVRTPGHLGQRGLHARYRCPGVVLRASTALAYGPGEDGCGPPSSRLLIETRGEGSYAIAPGSPPSCHETGRTWEHVAGPDLLHLPAITPAQREALLICARALDQRPAVRDVKGGRTDCRREAGAPHLPGNDFNREGPDWGEILAPHGWQPVRAAGPVRYWRRPGKDRGSWSATTGYCRSRDGCDLLHVFSSNAPPFRPGGSYSRFRAYGLLNHRGDYGAAARELARLGFGRKWENVGSAHLPQEHCGRRP